MLPASGIVPRHPTLHLLDKDGESQPDDIAQKLSNPALRDLPASEARPWALFSDRSNQGRKPEDRDRAAQVAGQCREAEFGTHVLDPAHQEGALPLDRSSMTRWRKRIGAGRLETLLADTLAIACDGGAVKPTAMERATIDTTVRTKAIVCPADGHLMPRAARAWRRAGPAPASRATPGARPRGSCMAAATSRACAIRASRAPSPVG